MSASIFDIIFLGPASVILFGFIGVALLYYRKIFIYSSPFREGAQSTDEASLLKINTQLYTKNKTLLFSK